MSGVKGKQDDGEWGIPVQRHKGDKLVDLKHDMNSASCWCIPDQVQVCRRCGVQMWSEEPLDEVAETPDKLPLIQKFKAQADPDCPTCHGEGLEGKYSDEDSVLFFHR